MFRRSKCNRFQKGVSATALAIALGAATPVWAQTDTSALEGRVDGVPAGTQVVVTDTNTGQRSVATVDASGKYRVIGLRPSSYSVSVAGKGTQTTTLFVGQTATLNFIAEGEDVIVVTGTRQVLDVRSSSVSTSITPAQIEVLPQNRRNFLSFAELAPGVAVTRGGNSQIQAGATSASNVNVLLDGISIKNPINHGGVFGQNFGLGNPFPQIAIQEYQVITQNFGAETGQAGSALVTAVTKTGGDEFHGSAFLEYQPNKFITQPFFDKKNGVPKPEFSRKQFGGELGGPIIPGVLNFYVAGEGTIESRPATSGFLPPGNTLPTSITSEILVPHSRDFKQGLYFGKLSWFATNNDSVDFTAFIRRENNLSDIDANAASTHGRTILTHENRYQLRWRHSAGDFLNVFNVSYDKATQETPSVGTGPEFIIKDSVSVSDTNDPLFNVLSNLNTNANDAQFGAHFFEQGDRQKTVTVKDDATWILGEHSLKTGFQVVHLDLSRTVNNTFNGTYYFANPGAGGSFDPTVPYGARINIQPTPTLNGKDFQLGFYVEDEWRPDDHWTINAGVRWDFETNANNNNYVTPAAIVTALYNYQGWAARGIDPADYISTGSNRKPQYGAIQPRIGFSYDFGGDGKTVLFGGAGRYYDRSLFIEGVIETLTNSNRIVGVDLAGACLGGNGPAYCTDADALRTFALTQLAGTGGDVWLLNNKTELPFSDQFDLGIRRQFGDIRVSVIYSHIRSHNIFQFTRANFYTNGWYSRFLQFDGMGNVIGCTDGGDAWIQDFTPNTTFAACPAGGGQLPGFSGKLNVGRNDGEARSNSVFVTIEKPFTEDSRWGLQTTFTYQRARTNVAQELNSDEFFNGASQTAYGTGYVNGVEKWRLVTSGQYRAPFDILVSPRLTLSSGPAFGNIIAPWNSSPSIQVPDGACCYGNLGGVFYPDKTFGYKRFDLYLEKSIETPWGHELVFNFEAFNVFNWLNRNYSSWGAGGGSPPPLVEDSQVGDDGRQFQVGVKYNF
ncbi:MAG: TonB-dependent receptor [Pseudomonadota bacterium]